VSFVIPKGHEVHKEPRSARRIAQ